MAREVFDPNATDGDGDGVVQDGTQFERPAETVLEEVIPEVKEAEEPAATVEDVVVEEKLEEAPAPKPTAPKKVSDNKSSEKVALFSTKNSYWQDLGRLSRGYNIVSKEDSIKWLTLEHVREASADEIRDL